VSQSLADAQSPNLTPSTFLSHFRNIRDLTRVSDEARMAVTRAKKAAKDDGVDGPSLKFLESLRKLDEDEAKIRVRHIFDYARYLNQPLGTQEDLFPEIMAKVEDKAAADQREWEAGDTGYLAGTGGKLRGDNPFPNGSPLAARWDKQFLRGMKVLADQMKAKSDTAADDKQAATATAPLAPKAAAATRGRQRKAGGNGAGQTIN
jgi:hypothetical protein